MTKAEHFKLLTKGERPNIVYKFHKVNNFLYDLLENHQFYFASQEELNDKDDLVIYLTAKGYYEAVKNAGEIPLPPYEDLDEDAIYKEMEKKNLVRCVAGVDDTQPVFTICCFTENKEQYMWKEYTGNGNGICMTFDLSHEKIEPGTMKSMLLPVNYVDDDFENTVDNSEEFFTALCTKKKNKWHKEQEWRMLSQLKKENFSIAMVSEITFGYNVLREDRIKIMDLCKKLGYTCNFKALEVKGEQLIDCDTDDF